MSKTTLGSLRVIIANSWSREESRFAPGEPGLAPGELGQAPFPLPPRSQKGGTVPVPMFPPPPPSTRVSPLFSPSIPMTEKQQRAAAASFAERWAGKGYEKGQSQAFWLDLLGNVLGVSAAPQYIEFENRIKLAHTSFI